MADDELTTASVLASAPAAEPPAPKTRRALLRAGFGALAASVAAAIGRPSLTNASAGSALIIGSEINNAGSANTQLLTNSSVVAFKLLQNGPGTALMGYVTPATGTTRGVYGRTDSPNGSGVEARNQGAAGSGSAVHAIGVNNPGVDATTDNANAFAIRATNLSSSNSGAGAIQGNGGQNIGVVGLTLSSSWYGVAAGNFSSAGTAMRADGGGTSGAGLVAYAANAVIGHSSAPSYAAVFGENDAITLESIGVYGKTHSADGPASGVRGIDSGGSGTTNGVFGTSSSSSGNGVFGQATTDAVQAYGVYGLAGGSTGYGVVSNGDLRIIGDLTASGSKAGYVVDLAVNGSADTLHQGDAVTLRGVRAPVIGTIPLLVVGPAGRGDAVIGVVDRRVSLTPDPEAPDGSMHAKASGTVAAPEEHLYVVTLGAFAYASVGATAGAVKAGARLAAGAKGKLEKATPVQVGGRELYASGEQVGYALGEVGAGSGIIGIFVSPH